MFTTLGIILAGCLLCGTASGNVTTNVWLNNSDEFSNIFSQLKRFELTDILNSLTRFLPVSEKIENEQCKEDSKKILNGFKNLEPWAVKFVDSSAKLQSGFLDGNIKNLGQFDQCVQARGQQFTGQYCLADVEVAPLPGAKFHDKIYQLIEIMTMGSKEREVGIDRNGVTEPDLLPSFSHIQLGVCVPSSCSSRDAELTLREGLEWLANSMSLQVMVHIPKDACSKLQVKPWTFAQYAFTLLLLSLLFLGVLAMIYDINYPDRSEDTLNIQMLRCFSISANWYRLWKTNKTPVPGTFASLDGIRALSTTWVVIAHKVLFFLQEPWANKYRLIESVTVISHMPMVNNMQSVDTFFMTSGLLRGYALLKDYDNNRHDFVSSAWKRYVRLTPAYAVMIAFFATLADRLADGPSWYKFMEGPAAICRTNWPNNLLYINNYIHYSKHCMIQTWYLATDMQLFLLAPLLMYPVWRWPNRAIKILLSATFIATLIPFLYTFYTSALPTYLPSASDLENLRYQAKVHFPTHSRASSYIVGLALGLVMFKIGTNRPKLSAAAVVTGWTVSLYTLYEVIYGVFDMMQYDYKYEPLRVALYGSLHRPAWALGVAWIVFACHYGYGGWINSFLCAKFFQPLSKLSYCTFLVHYLILMVGIGRLRAALYLDEYEMFRGLIADAVIVTTASAILHIFVEAPTLELIKVFQRRDTNNSKKNTTISTPATVQETTDIINTEFLKTKQS